MSHKVNSISLTLLMIAVSAAIFVFCYSATAQNSIEKNDAPIPLPSEEEFQKTDALATPWRSSGCHLNVPFNEPDCYMVSLKDQREKAHILTLYDENAALWYRFSVSPDSTDYYYKNKKKDFLPFGPAIDPNLFYPNIIYLRLIGESPHWYKVEVNEETQATKYILKSDPMWSKTSWSYWLFSDYSIKIDFDKTPLYDKPNGQIIEALSGGTYIYAGVLKVEGDWVYVKGIGSAMDSNKYFKGWIKWREGRKLLAKTTFNWIYGKDPDPNFSN